MDSSAGTVLLVAVFIFLFWFFKCLNVLREYERAVVFRLGHVLSKDKGPGVIVIFWPIDKMVRVSLRTVTWDVPPQDVITRDNVSLKVNAVVYFRVVNASRPLSTSRATATPSNRRPRRACGRCWVKWSLMTCSPSAKSSTAGCRPSSTSIRSRGA